MVCNILFMITSVGQQTGQKPAHHPKSPNIDNLGFRRGKVLAVIAGLLSAFGDVKQNLTETISTLEISSFSTLNTLIISIIFFFYLITFIFGYIVRISPPFFFLNRELFSEKISYASALRLRTKHTAQFCRQSIYLSTKSNDELSTFKIGTII